MAFGTARPSQKCRQFFYVPFRERGFRRVTFLKGDKSQLSNIVIFYIIEMQTLYWFENTKKIYAWKSIFESTFCWITIKNKLIYKKKDIYY